MAIILAVLLLALTLGGLGFAERALRWIALIVLVLWLLGFFFTGAASAGPRRRWRQPPVTSCRPYTRSPLTCG